jgi:cell division protein FtsI/penicillin-binding protein 2
MTKQKQFARLAVLAAFLVAGFIGLAYRLVDLQVLRHDELAKEARNNTEYTYRLEPRRGDILDCNGNLLATSVFVKTVCADPSLISDRHAQVAQALAPLLQMPEAELEQRLMRAQVNKEGTTVVDRQGRPVLLKNVRLKTKVSPDTWEKIQETMAKLPLAGGGKPLSKKQQDLLRDNSIFTEPVDDQLRNYPNNSLAAHVIGFLGLAAETNNGVRTEVTIGMDGIERKFDTKLRGIRGFRVTERDGKKRELVALRAEDVPPHDGLSVVLTIDSVIQHILETALAQGMKDHAPISISGMVIRPRTGEILAMATLPNFDPNNLAASTSESRRNRLISEVEEPGSTFKIVVVSGALADHTVKLSDPINCENGQFTYAGKVLHDHKPFGILSVENVITKSSNIGAAKIGIAMHEPRLYEYIRGFGFGTATGIPLPAESRGIVHDVTNWTRLSISRIPMGHEIGVTSLQMAMAMSAVANHGVLMQPLLVDRLVEPDGSVAVKYFPQPVRRVISEEADRDIIEALKTVVSKDGTAAAAAMTNYTVAGKTGTAQKVEGSGYSTDKFFSSFIGFFPADNPEICIYVAMDEPKDGHYGGDVAAPVFKEIAVQVASYLNIRPDKGNATGLPEMESAPATNAPVRATIARMK